MVQQGDIITMHGPLDLDAVFTQMLVHIFVFGAFNLVRFTPRDKPVIHGGTANWVFSPSFICCPNGLYKQRDTLGHNLFFFGILHNDKGLCKSSMPNRCAVKMTKKKKHDITNPRTVVLNGAVTSNAYIML
jgi:hypothetical protein